MCSIYIQHTALINLFIKANKFNLSEVIDQKILESYHENEKFQVYYISYFKMR